MSANDQTAWEPEGPVGGTEMNSIETKYIKQDRWSQECVDRYTSKVIFLLQFAQLFSCISHCMAQVSVCARHSILSSVRCCF